MFILDTNMCIFCIKEQPEQVVKRVKSYQPFEIKISAITVAELEYGACKSRTPEKNRQVLIKFLSSFDILPFDDIDAEAYGRIRSHLEREGKTIGPLDMQIAAQAIARDFTIVTNNTREFVRVPGIQHQDWSTSS